MHQFKVSGIQSEPPPPAFITMRLTKDLYRCHDEVAGEQLSELGRATGLSGKGPLQQSEQVVTQGCRDEEAVDGHLHGLGVDFERGEKLC